MAERRMFAKTIVLSDAFLDMPLSARCLYFTLGMLADDEGFVNSPKSIMRQIGATEDDLKILIAKSFLIAFEDGVVVIKHWRINNYLQKDRLNQTLYFEHRNALSLDSKNAYVIGESSPSLPNVYTEDDSVYTQYSIGKDRIGKDSIGEDIEDASASAPPSKHKYGSYKNVLLSDDEVAKLKERLPDWEAKVENLSCYIASKGVKYKSHYATILNWERMDAKRAGAAQPKDRWDVI